MPVLPRAPAASRPVGIVSRVELVGGPLDGHEIAKRSGRYAWVRGTSFPGLPHNVKLQRATPLLRLLPGAAASFFVGGSATSEPRNGAALYELVDGVAIYAGHRKTWCNACCCYHGRAEGGREKRPCALGGDDSAR